MLVRIFFAAVFLFSASTQAKTFVYCSEASPSTFNPQIGVDGATFNATSRAMYNRLLEFEYGGTKVIPSLATSWSISKDAKTFTFKLRKGVKFHATRYFTPTREFNADDVLFTFNRMRQKKHPYHSVNGGKYEYFESMAMGKILKDIRKVDEYTIQFVLSRPEAPFLANLAMDFASIISKEYGDKLVKQERMAQLDFMPIGTGPFVFDRYVKQKNIYYLANQDYFEGPPKIGKLQFNIVEDAGQRFQKLKSGECHFANQPSPSDLLDIKSHPKLKIMTQSGLNTAYLAMNVEKKPFDNKLVRQAVNMALNRKEYVKQVYVGHAKVAKNPIPPRMWSYNKSVKDYQYSPEKAKALLKKAGVKTPINVTLWTLPVTRAYNPNGKLMGELMKKDLAKVGIQAKLVTYDWAKYRALSLKGDHDMIQLGWTGDNGDPDNFLNVLLGCEAVRSGINRARWCHKVFNHLISRAKVTTNIRQRSVFYEKAQKIFKDEAPWVTLAHSTVYKAMSKEVIGYKISPFGIDSFYPVDLKQ